MKCHLERFHRFRHFNKCTIHWNEEKLNDLFLKLLGLMNLVAETGSLALRIKTKE